MAYVVELYPDPETEDAVRATWQALAEAGISSFMLDGGYRPHVSLAISDDVNLQSLIEATAVFTASLHPFRLTLSSVGTFPTAEGVLFFGVTVTHTLLEAHAEYHRVFERFARQPYAYYRVGTWVPHCTLAIGLAQDQLGQAAQIAQQTRLPLYGLVHEMGIVRVAPDTYRSLALFQLGRPV